MDNRRGFTLIELMIVIAIIAIIASIAIPGLLRARLAANETAAIGTLKSICTAEFQFRNAAIVDQDGDGTGEYAWMQELCGTSGYRDRFGALSGVPVSPGFISSVLGSTAAASGGIGNKSGYAYLVYLPTDAGPAVAEGAGPPTFTLPDDANPQENRFVVYAWPASVGNSGNRAFAISGLGVAFSTANSTFQNYTGASFAGTVPPPEAAFVGGATDDITNLEGDFVVDAVAGDGFTWTPAGN